jgi:hypothetical protein
MLNNDHTQVVVAIFRLFNGLKKNKYTGISRSKKFPYFIINKRFRTKEEITKLNNRFESVVIKIVNFHNKIVNFFVNNKFSNWLKELLQYKMDYPVYLYCDEGKFYVYEILDGKLDDGKKYSDVTVCDRESIALNIQGYSRIGKWRLLKKVNKITKLSFRYKRLITYENQRLTDS